MSKISIKKSVKVAESRNRLRTASRTNIIVSQLRHQNERIKDLECEIALNQNNINELEAGLRLLANTMRTLDKNVGIAFKKVAFEMGIFDTRISDLESDISSVTDSCRASI